MMYEKFKNAAMCFRILNGTNQFGCSSKFISMYLFVRIVFKWTLKNVTVFKTKLFPHKNRSALVCNA